MQSLGTMSEWMMPRLAAEMEHVSRQVDAADENDPDAMETIGEKKERMQQLFTTYDLLSKSNFSVLKKITDSMG